jgi:CRISPR type IV-associated protein Csf2
MIKDNVIFSGYCRAVGGPITQLMGSKKTEGSEEGEKSNFSLCRKSTVITTIDNRRIKIEVPTLSPMTIRAMYRCQIAYLMYQAVGDSHIDYESLMVMFQGGGGFAKQSAHFADVMKHIEEVKGDNVGLALFGASMKGVPSHGKVIVSEARPICRETIASGALWGDYDANKYESLSASDLIVREDFYRQDIFKRPEILSLLSEDGIKAMMEHDEKLAEQKNNKGEKDENGKKVKKDKVQPRQMPYSLEVIPAGTEFDQYIIVKNATEIEVGAFLAALQQFAKAPFIGALSSQGKGALAIEYKVKAGDREFGTVSVDGKGGFNAKDGLLEDYLAVFNSYLDDLRKNKPALF